MKKILLVILVCSFIVLGISGCKKSDEFTLNIYKLNEVSSITIDTMSQYDNTKEFTDENSINEIYNVFINKKTNIESVNDTPVNPDTMYVINFKTKNDDSKLIYIYKKGNNYFIEQPYNGVYQLTKEEYNLIETFIK